jgi:hypothetical protein
MALAQRTHTEGDRRRWVLRYKNWLPEHQQLSDADVVSDSTTLTVSDVEIRDAREVIFFLNGGAAGETVTVTVTVTRTDTSIKVTTLTFTVVAP